MTGVYFDSFQSQRAMGLFQLMVVFGFFFDGGGPRQRGRSRMAHEASRGIDVIFFLFRVLREDWLGQLSLYPIRCVFSLIRNTYTYYKKESPYGVAHGAATRLSLTSQKAERP